MLGMRAAGRLADYWRSEAQRWEADRSMGENLCPACGPVREDLSSRYCAEHLRELIAHCLELPSVGRGLRPDPVEWLEPVVAGARAG